MNRPIKIALLFLVPLLFAVRTAGAEISITVSGDWFEAIDKNDLQAGPGSDLESSYASISGQVTIGISGTSGPQDAWRVDLHKVDGNWHGNLQPYARRTSDGSGGSVSGGSSYQRVTDISTSFFSGAGDVSDIKVQLSLNNVSIQILPDSYSTVFYYTVVDIP
jgi:hypothetical protein